MLCRWAMDHIYTSNCIKHLSRKSFNPGFKQKVRNGTGLFPCLVGGLELNFIANRTPFKSKITCKGYFTSPRKD